MNLKDVATQLFIFIQSTKTIKILFMKKILFIVVFFAWIWKWNSVEAQLYNPYYALYCGYVTCMPISNGYYMGPVMYGFPHGNEGYAYYYDWGMQSWVAYHGGFNQGRCHGQGEVMCNYGYIMGYWNNGTLVEQINVNQNYIQQSYNNIMQQSQSYAPQNSNTISLPPGTEIKEIESSSELGSKLLGKMRK